MEVIIVGENGFNTIQSAIDEMATLGLHPGNRGTIVVPPGYYKERVSDYVSHLDVIAQIPGTAVIEYTGGDSGGTYRIGRKEGEQLPVEAVDKVLSGLRIVRNDPGLPTPGSHPPESALDVGWPEHDFGLWESIIIRNCIVEGVHDAIQIGGWFNGSPPGLVVIRDCILRCVHDALAAFGDYRLISKNNLIHVDTRGIDPYLTDIADWKSTGFHMNRNTGSPNPLASFLSSHDTMYLIGGENVGEEGMGTGGHSQMAGYLFYDLKGPTQHISTLHRTTIVEPHIHLEWNHDETPDNPIAGVSVWTSGVDVPRDFLTIVGGSITVRQTSTHQNAPDVVSGVRVDTEGANDDIDSIVRVLGTNIRVENLKSGGHAYSLHTVGEHDKIEADVYSDEPISEPTTGTITPADHKP